MDADCQRWVRAALSGGVPETLLIDTDEVPAAAILIDDGWRSAAARPRLAAGEAATRSARAIGRDLGVSADTVLRAMRLQNIPVRFATAPHKGIRLELEDREWLNAQYEQRTAAEIGARLGVAASTVTAA